MKTITKNEEQTMMCVVKEGCQKVDIKQFDWIWADGIFNTVSVEVLESGYMDFDVESNERKEINLFKVNDLLSQILTIIRVKSKNFELVKNEYNITVLLPDNSPLFVTLTLNHNNKFDVNLTKTEALKLREQKRLEIIDREIQKFRQSFDLMRPNLEGLRPNKIVSLL